MAQQYLLPCECGKANPVTVAQAGRTLACDCGREYKVPTLAALRQLEPVEQPVSKSRQSTQWSSTRGILFVLGVLLALVGLIAGGLNAYSIRNVDMEQVRTYYDSIEDAELDEIDHMTPVQAYEVWGKIRQMSPGTTGSAPVAQIQRFYDSRLRGSIIAFGAAAVGILMAAGSLIGVGSKASSVKSARIPDPAAKSDVVA